MCNDAVSAGGDSSFSVCHRGLSERLALLCCAESTTLLNVIDEYFSVNTLFVLPVQVRGQCRQS